ncbi:MAG: prolyl oligopeptidase family serine peptidase [Candidatus Aegiribacteria sp.]|nr:prolyl oligopeptidase family serine peptidase [Candidatus Aegiribacteria sp.]
MYLFFAALIALSGTDGIASSGYMEPDQVLIDIVDVQWAPWTSVSPDYQNWLLRIRQKNLSIEELAQDELKLAGMRFSPQTFAPGRSRRFVAMSLMRYPEIETVEISGLPENPRILSTSWSPDGSRIAFTHETPEGVELWIIDEGSAEARRLTGPVLSLTANEWPEWLSDGSGIICCIIPFDNGEPPVENSVPSGPVIQETTGVEAPVRTYQDLLENPYDEDLFEYYLTSQLSVVRMDGSIDEVGDPGIIWYYSPSPDAEYILVSQLMRPFSYMVTAGRFAELIEVWDLEGNTVYEVADFPVRDAIPIARGSTFEGPRSMNWRSDADATLCWVEALDGGDAGAEAELRDRIFVLEAPFDSEPAELFELRSRFGGIEWGNDSLAIVYEWWWPTRNLKAWRIRPGQPDSEALLLVDRSMEDRYSDPGIPRTRFNSRGKSVLVTSTDGISIYLAGEGASPEGDRPFLDRLDLSTLETERLFHSQPPYYEQPLRFINDECTKFMFVRESVDEYPNYFIRDLANNTDVQVTFYSNPVTVLDGMYKELITYKREDGLDLSATLYLPPDYDAEEGPLPMVMWAYPQNYRSASAAGQISGSPYEYDYIGWWSPLVWLTQGYAVLDDPAMPIVGEGEEQPNDTFVEQLVMSAQAAVDEVVDRGVADPDRIAIGGHSYGAFMTANLLAHSDIFAAGLARTGAYNRTLTPFGFQSEDRSLWEAKDVYIEMSPFMNADLIDEPILLIHGDADSNPGTFPMQSERFFAALKGLGGTSRLVMLPLESHIYKARESILHVLWETQEWLNQYVGGQQ